MAKDIYHPHVREALMKDGWTITHDPYNLDIDIPSPLLIDLGAEKLISAEKGTEKIAVEIKSFVARSLTYEFHSVFGQFIIYRTGILITDPERKLFLALPNDAYIEIQQRTFYMNLILEYQINIISFNPISKTIDSWIKFPVID